MYVGGGGLHLIKVSTTEEIFPGAIVRTVPKDVFSLFVRNGFLVVFSAI